MRSPWHVIRNTFGVSELVRTGGQLARVPLEIIERLKQHEATPQALFNAGETLRVKNGPFQNLEVVFDMQDGDSRAIRDPGNRLGRGGKLLSHCPDLSPRPRRSRDKVGPD